MNAQDEYEHTMRVRAEKRREARWMAVFGAAVALSANGLRDVPVEHRTGIIGVWVSQAEELANLVDMATQPTRDEWEKRQIEALAK
jgi:hypothetical protein